MEHDVTKLLSVPKSYRHNHFSKGCRREWLEGRQGQGDTLFQINLYLHDDTARNLFSMMQFGYMSEKGILRINQQESGTFENTKIVTLTKDEIDLNDKNYAVNSEPKKTAFLLLTVSNNLQNFALICPNLYFQSSYQ